MKKPVYEVVVGESLPDLSIWVTVNRVLLSDLSSGNTFTLLIRTADDDDDLVLKTSGFLGQTGSGTQSSGVPNLVVQWAVDELNVLSPDRTHRAVLTIKRTLDQKVRYYEFVIRAIGRP